MDNKVKVLKEIKYNAKKANERVYLILMINIWNLVLLMVLIVFRIIK